MAKLLIVDDSKEMRSALSDILSGVGHSVTVAEDGRVARELINSRNFDLVITDFQMPNMDGMQLLQWIKANRPVPVVLITGFAHILETQEAYKMGASDFITKPFSYKEIINSIDRILKPASELSLPADVDSQYCSVPIEDFVSNDAVKINVYIRLSQEKYLRVAHHGDKLPPDRLEKYKLKGIGFLYTKKNEFATLVNFNLKVAQSLKDSNIISSEKKEKFMRYTMETCLEGVVINGIDRQSFESAKQGMQIYFSILGESPRVVDLLNILNSHASWVYGHSIGVGLYSVMIGKKLGWSWQPTLFKLATSGLFHDIGQKELANDIIAKPRPMLSLDERKSFESHVTRSRDILQQLPEMPSDIWQIVYDHHEDCTGLGYPRRITKQKIHPLAKVVQVADWFCYYAIKSPHSEGCSAGDAIQQMLHNQEGQLDGEAMKALKALSS